MGWSAVLYSPYNSTTESIFGLNGTYRKRIDDDATYEWGMDAPDTRPTIAAGNGTGLTGDYNAKYTWCRKEKTTLVYESNPSDEAQAVVTLSNEDLRVTFIEPPDEQINGSTYSYDTEVPWANKNYSVCHTWEETGAYISGDAYRFTTTDTYQDSEDTFSWEPYHDQYSGTASQLWAVTGKGENEIKYADLSTADGSLGTTVVTTHNRPPLGTYVFGPSFNGTLFIIKDHRLYFSLPKQPEYWPATYYIDVCSVQYGGVCGVFYDKQPYYLTKNKIYYIYGSSASDFLPKDMAAKTGTQSQNGALAVEGYGIFHVGSDGIYLFMPSTDYRHGKDEKISKPLDPIFRGETKNGVAGIGDLSKSWLAIWEDKVYFGYPGINDTYPTNILVYYLNEKRVCYHTRGQEIHAVGVDNYNNGLIAVDGDGYAWKIEDNSVTTDAGTALSWEVESKAFTLQTRRHFPRWAKYDVDSSGADSANGYVILDGASCQTHTLSDNRNTRRRLITPTNGRRLSHRISGSGPIEIRAVESE
jgi:hypothetical protein